MSKAVAFEIHCSARKCKIIEGSIKDHTLNETIDLTGVKIIGIPNQVEYIFELIKSVDSSSEIKSDDEPYFEEDFKEGENKTI